jgi:hypothetical protein
MSAYKWDFFISYTQADRPWAEWIAWTLEEDGHRALIQAWDFVPGTDWLAGMQAGTRDAARTVAVLSDAYLASVHGSAEWQAALAGDLDGSERKLLLVRVSSCGRPGLLAGRVGVDLFGVDEPTARDRLRKMIDAAMSGRAKPLVAPVFPGAGRAIPADPGFPGGTSARPVPEAALAGTGALPAQDALAALAGALSSARWKEADMLTELAMKQAAGRSPADYLADADLRALPCEILSAVDSLWRSHSDGRFGFSAQMEIWNAIGALGTAPVPDGDPEREFGWRVAGAWLPYDEYTFTLAAPPGHLPRYICRHESGWWLGKSCLICTRLRDCTGCS